MCAGRAAVICVRTLLCAGQRQKIVNEQKIENGDRTEMTMTTTTATVIDHWLYTPTNLRAHTHKLYIPMDRLFFVVSTKKQELNDKFVYFPTKLKHYILNVPLSKFNVQRHYVMQGS